MRSNSYHYDDVAGTLLLLAIIVILSTQDWQKYWKFITNRPQQILLLTWLIGTSLLMPSSIGQEIKSAWPTTKHFEIHQELSEVKKQYPLNEGVAVQSSLGVHFLLTYHLFRKETDFKKYLIIGFLSVISVSPQLLKNYIYTGNPLFPGFTSVIPGNLNQTMLNYYGNHFGNSFELKHFFLQIYDLFSGKAVLILLPFFALFRKGESNDEASKYLFVGSLIFLLYLFYNGDSLNPRFYFSVYFLLIISVFIYIKNSKINSNKIATIIFILAIIDSKIDLSIKGSYRIIKDYSNLNEKEIINTHIPLTKLWGAIEPATELEYIISDHLSNSYYLPKNIRLHTAVQSLNSDFILKCNDPQEFQKLKKYKYALISRDNQNICYDFILNKGQLMEKN